MKFDRKSHLIIKDGQKIELPHKTWRVALAVFDAAPQTVDRNDLIDQIWGGNYYIGEKALNQAMWTIRTALGDDARAPEFIRTIPGEGYQWIGECHRSQPLLRRRLIAVAVVALSVVIIPQTSVTISTNPTLIAAAAPPTTIETNTGHHARFAPDKIRVTTSKGCILNILSRPNQRFSSPVFSANGKTLAFNLSESQICKLIIVDLETKQHQKFNACPRGA